MNWQIPIMPEGEFNNSRITNINVKKIDEYVSGSCVAVIPGFQGISKSGDITSIGRGGSDATAVAIAKIFNTDSCDIYTDVDGVYSSDPKKNKNATRYKKLKYMDVLGKDLKVMDAAAISLARENNVPVIVFSIHEIGAFAKVVSGDGKFSIIQ